MLVLFIIILLTIPAPAHSQPTAGVQSQNTLSNMDNVQKESKRNKEIQVERGRARTSAKAKARRRERARARSESVDFSRRAERQASASRELTVNPGQLVAGAIQRVENGEGWGRIARLIRALPVLSRPCRPVAQVYGFGAVVDRVDCLERISSLLNPGKGPAYYNFQFQPGDDRPGQELIRRLVGAYLLRAELAQTALDDLARGGSITIPPGRTPEDVVFEAVRRHLDDWDLAERAWRDAGRIVFGQPCRLPTAMTVLNGKYDWNCGTFVVSDPFGPHVTWAGMDLFGKEILGRAYAFRRSGSATSSVALARSRRSESSARSTTSTEVSRRSESTARTSARLSRGITSSRSASSRRESSTSANIGVSAGK